MADLPSAPKALRHPSLRQRPRSASPFALSAKGASHGSGLRPCDLNVVATWGVAPGWDNAGPLALSAAPLPSAPKAQRHPSLGQRPRSAHPFALSAKGASYDRPPNHDSGLRPCGLLGVPTWGAAPGWAFGPERSAISFRAKGAAASLNLAIFLPI